MKIKKTGDSYFVYGRGVKTKTFDTYEAAKSYIDDKITTKELEHKEKCLRLVDRVRNRAIKFCETDRLKYLKRQLLNGNIEVLTCYAEEKQSVEHKINAYLEEELRWN